MPIMLRYSSGTHPVRKTYQLTLPACSQATVLPSTLHNTFQLENIALDHYDNTYMLVYVLHLVQHALLQRKFATVMRSISFSLVYVKLVLALLSRLAGNECVKLQRNMVMPHQVLSRRLVSDCAEGNFGQAKTFV